MNYTVRHDTFRVYSVRKQAGKSVCVRDHKMQTSVNLQTNTGNSSSVVKVTDLHPVNLGSPPAGTHTSHW